METISVSTVSFEGEGKEGGLRDKRKAAWFLLHIQRTHARDKATQSSSSSNDRRKMGKEQSKLSTTLTSCPAAETVNGEIPLEKLLQVQRTIVKEYPFLESVYESMLLTDNTLPDCPIVFANEHV